ncbi:MAG: DUF3347 domain-containing protein [Opitutaceae bacterium]
MNTIRQKVRLLLVASILATGAMAAAQQEPNNPLVESYMKVGTALADDDLRTAQGAAAAMIEDSKVGGIPEQVSTAASSVADAKDLASARVGFQALSTAVQNMIEESTSDGESVYLMRCPMAFGGKGGTWLQLTTAVSNPYFGSKMLHCGGVVREIEGGPATDSDHSHSNH